MKLFTFVAHMSRRDGLTNISSVVMGYRVMQSADEARGSFIESAFKSKPGFELVELLEQEVPSEHLALLKA